MNQEKIIMKVLAQSGEWTPSFKLIMRDTEWGWLGSSADRKARLLTERGEIERKRHGKYAYYRIKETLF